MDPKIEEEINELEDRLDYLEHIHPDRTWTIDGFITGAVRGWMFILVTVILSALVAFLVSYKFRKS